MQITSVDQLMKMLDRSNKGPRCGFKVWVHDPSGKPIKAYVTLYPDDRKFVTVWREGFGVSRKPTPIPAKSFVEDGKPKTRLM